MDLGIGRIVKPYNVIVSIPGHRNLYEIEKKIDTEQEGSGEDKSTKELGQEQEHSGESRDKKRLMDELPAALIESFKKPKLIETASIIFPKKPKEIKRKNNSKEDMQGYGKKKIKENEQNNEKKHVKHKFQFL